MTSCRQCERSSSGPAIPQKASKDLPVKNPRPRIVGHESDDCELAKTANADNVTSHRVLKIVGIAVSTLDHAERVLKFVVKVSNGKHPKMP